MTAQVPFVTTGRGATKLLDPTGHAQYAGVSWRAWPQPLGALLLTEDPIDFGHENLQLFQVWFVRG